MSFEPLKFTAVGKALQIRALSGDQIVFTKIQVGEGSLTPESISARTTLVSLIKSINITKSTRTDDRYTIEGTFRNDEIPRSFYYRELGIFAADPDYPNDRSKDILYAYQNAYDTAEYISISSGEIIEKLIRVNLFVGEAETVSAVIDSSTVFVTQDEMSEALKGKADAEHSHTVSDISDFPESLPANGGNADSVGNIAAAGILRNLGQVTEAAALDDATFNEYSYEADVSAAVAAALGLSSKWYTIRGFKYSGAGKYGIQLAFPRNHAGQVMFRYANGADWTAWKSLADGGSAATVNGHTVNTDVPADADFTDTTYEAGAGVAISGTTISNSGVRAVETGSANGTIAVNTNGTVANIAVRGLADAAYQALQTNAAAIGLHRISCGTADAVAANCPAGCLYGKYDG